MTPCCRPGSYASLVLFYLCHAALLSIAGAQYHWSLHRFSDLLLFHRPLKYRLYACLMMLTLCMRHTCPNHLSLLCLKTSVIDSGGKVFSLIVIFCSMSALITSLIARRQRISKTSRDCISSYHSVQASAP